MSTRVCMCAPSSWRNIKISNADRLVLDKQMFFPKQSRFTGIFRCAHVFVQSGSCGASGFIFPYLQLLPEQLYLFLHLKHYCRRLTGLKEDFLLKTLQPGTNQSGGMTLDMTMWRVPKQPFKHKFLLLDLNSFPTFSPWMIGQTPEPLQALHLRLQQKREEDWQFSPKAQVTQDTLPG